MKYRKTLFVLVASLCMLWLTTGCEKPSHDEPVGEPVYNHWKLQVDPYEYPNYSLVSIQLQTSATEKELLELTNYEVAAFDSEGRVAGLTSATSAMRAEMCLFGESGDTFSFRVWDCLRQKERDLHGTFSLVVSESIPVVTLY